MRRAIAPLVILLFWAAGCETEQNPEWAVHPPAPDFPLLLTDGFCLVSGNRVVLDRYDIDYYDFSSHLIYLNETGAFEEKYQKPGTACVYADSIKIYELSLVSHFASYIPQGPVIWYPLIFYPDYTVHIDMAWYYAYEWLDKPDPREDPNIVEALERYGQFRHGLQGEISAVRYTPPGHVELELELLNEDSLNYYYYDPEKMGMGVYHYFTNGLFINDTATHKTYTHDVTHVQLEAGSGTGLEWMSLLEAGSSATITLIYDSFDEIPPGTYFADFVFPGPHSVAERGELEQEDGRIWLGDLDMSSIITIE